MIRVSVICLVVSLFLSFFIKNRFKLSTVLGVLGVYSLFIGQNVYYRGFQALVAFGVGFGIAFIVHYIISSIRKKEFEDEPFLDEALENLFFFIISISLIFPIVGIMSSARRSSLADFPLFMFSQGAAISALLFLFIWTLGDSKKFKPLITLGSAGLFFLFLTERISGAPKLEAMAKPLSFAVLNTVLILSGVIFLMNIYYGIKGKAYKSLLFSTAIAVPFAIIPSLKVKSAEKQQVSANEKVILSYFKDKEKLVEARSRLRDKKLKQFYYFGCIKVLNKDLDDAKAAISSLNKYQVDIGQLDLSQIFESDNSQKLKDAIKENPELLKIQNSKGEELTLLAMQFKAVNCLRVLLDEKMSPNAKTSLGLTLLHIAAGRPWFEGVEILIVNGANVNSVSEYGDTPLTLAHDLRVIRLLIDKGAQRKIEGANTKDPFLICANNANLELMYYYLDHGASWKDLEDKNGDSLGKVNLSSLSKDRVLNLLNRMEKSGIKPSKKLLYAVLENENLRKSIEEFYNKGLKIVKETDPWSDPIVYQMGYGDLETVKFLESKGVSTDIAFIRIYQDANFAKIHLIKEHILNKKYSEETISKAIKVCIENMNADGLSELLKNYEIKDISITARNMSFIADRNKWQILDLILDKKLNIKGDKEWPGRRFVYKAVKENRKIFLRLLDHGYIPKQTDNFSNSDAAVAVFNDDLDLLKIMEKKGFNLLQYKDSHEAVKIAKQNKATKCLEYFKTNGFKEVQSKRR